MAGRRKQPALRANECSALSVTVFIIKREKSERHEIHTDPHKWQPLPVSITARTYVHRVRVMIHSKGKERQ